MKSVADEKRTKRTPFVMANFIVSPEHKERHEDRVSYSDHAYEWVSYDERRQLTVGRRNTVTCTRLTTPTYLPRVTCHTCDIELSHVWQSRWSWRHKMSRNDMASVILPGAVQAETVASSYIRQL